MIKTEKFVRSKLKVWQKRLNLCNWEIDLRFVEDISISGYGEIFIRKSFEKATINILKVDERPKSNKESDNDMELDLLHELVHLRLWSIDPDEPDKNTHYLREQAVENIAKALLKAEGNKT